MKPPPHIVEVKNGGAILLLMAWTGTTLPSLVAFAKLREATISFMCVGPLLCPHGSTRLPLDGFS